MRDLVVGFTAMLVVAMSAEAQPPASHRGGTVDSAHVSGLASAARLTWILDPYVAMQGLGYMCHERLRLQLDGTDVEPSPALVVRQSQSDPRQRWARAPAPVLVVEIVSANARQGDAQKRSMYLSAGVAEYWMVDPDARTITVARAGRPDVVARDQLIWWPPGADAPLTIDVRGLFS